VIRPYITVVVAALEKMRHSKPLGTLSIVIPAYNEEHGIREIIQRVLSTRHDLNKMNIELIEVLVIDDGSVDRTATIVQESQDIVLISHNNNRGYGAALKSGFAHAHGDLIGFLDADGTYPPEYFPNLCQEFASGADLVIGSRMAGRSSQMPAARKVGNKFFAWLLSRLGWERVTDSASGMRVFRREILNRLLPLPDGLNLTPVMSTRAIHEGLRTIEVPIPYDERQGHSKLNVIKDGFLFLQSIIWTVFAYNPVRILGIIGLGGFFTGLVIGLVIIALRVSGITSLGAWGVASVFIGMVSVVGGISIFTLGVTFNYLVSLFYRQPLRQGLFGKPLLQKPLERYFGLFGLLSTLSGLLLGCISTGLGLSGWPMDRLWFYLLFSVMLFLVGIQLLISWVLARTLEELSERTMLQEKQIEPVMNKEPVDSESFPENSSKIVSGRL